MAQAHLSRLNLSTTSILVAGGSTFELDVLMQILGGFGVGVLRRAETLDAAQQILSREPVDFVLLDHRLGDDSGLQFTHRLRRMQGEVRQVPVLMVTAFSYAAMVTAARDAGADFIVTKPLTPRVLFERMCWLAESRRAFVEAPDYIGPDRRVRAFGPPPDTAGRREGDLPPEVGHATEPNLSQEDIDAFFTPQKVRS